MPLLKACLNGDRSRRDHGAVPVTATELAAEAFAAAAAGATAVHVHPRGVDEAESLAWADVEQAVAAIRDRCPGLAVGVSTREEICPDLRARLQLLSAWSGPDAGPDFASVNWHEPAAAGVAEALAGRGIGVEAGLFSPLAARDFAASGWPARVVRVLVEALPGISPGADGVSAAGATLAELGDLVDQVEVVVHGEQDWSWPVLGWADSAGYGIRVGFEDVLVGPGGEPVFSNGELVDLARRARRRSAP